VSRGLEGDALFSERPGHLTELAREAADGGASLLVVVGGDGSVNEVSNGIAGRKDVELAVLARTVARSALEVFGASDRVRFEVSGDVRLPARVGSSLAIVLNELVTNALKHAQAHKVSVELNAGARELGVVVADDGCGMAEPPGHGSGLMIVRAVVANELGGHVRIEPAEAGTRVAISIPLERAGESPSAG
jgi:two-component sensor histidine kinase